VSRRRRSSPRCEASKPLTLLPDSGEGPLPYPSFEILEANGKVDVVEHRRREPYGLTATLKSDVPGAWAVTHGPRKTESGRLMARAILTIAMCCVLSSACSIGTYIPTAVTTERLLEIRDEMTYEQVEALIGPPLCVSSIEDDKLSAADTRLAHDLVRSCGPFQRSTTSVPVNLRQAAKLNLSYAEPRESLVDPNIYVNFRGGRVAGIYVKRDDLGICCMNGLDSSPFFGGGSRDALRDLIGR
jgi:hypothetical protein